jgi:hypothetical protein
VTEFEGGRRGMKEVVAKSAPVAKGWCTGIFGISATGRSISSVRAALERAGAVVEVDGQTSLRVRAPQELFVRVGDVLRLAHFGADRRLLAEYLEKDEYYSEVTVGEEGKVRVYSTMGRLIGTSGSTKKKIEELSATKLLFSDSAVAIVGNYEGVEIARRAIEEIIKGKPQSSVVAGMAKRFEAIKRKEGEMMR